MMENLGILKFQHPGNLPHGKGKPGNHMVVMLEGAILHLSSEFVLKQKGESQPWS